jgi:hypothetical protein
MKETKKESELNFYRIISQDITTQRVAWEGLGNVLISKEWN